MVLLNTCSVRDMAEQKALGKMGLLSGCAKQARDGLRLPRLHGAIARAGPGARLRHVDLVVGTQKFHRVAEYVDEIVQRKRACERMDDARFSIVDVEEEPGSQETIRDHVSRGRQATAFVSIMQGCNMHCTFCIVPSTRGAERIAAIAEIVREVEGSSRAA